MQQKEELENAKGREIDDEIDPRAMTREILKGCNVLRDRNAAVIPTRPHLREVKDHKRIQEMKALFNSPGRHCNSSLAAQNDSFKLPSGGYEPESPAVSTLKGMKPGTPLHLKLNKLNLE